MHYILYEENRKHGDDFFPMAYYSVDERPPQYSMPVHWHKEAEFMYILRGEFDGFLDGKKVRYKEGELVYIPGGMTHGGEGVNCAYECICFDQFKLLQQPPVVRSYLNILENEDWQIQNLFTHQQMEILKGASRMFAAAREQKKGWEMLVLAGMYDFFGTVTQKGYQKRIEETQYSRSYIQKINAAIEYIASHYKESVTLEDLAKTVALSTQYFCKCFQKATGKTPITYLNTYRVERACFLLEQKNSMVTDVALECGFNDVSYFIRCFKKHKGVTPYQYIKKMQKRNE